MAELNIGHSIVARAVMVGFEQAVREMKTIGIVRRAAGVPAAVRTIASRGRLGYHDANSRACVLNLQRID